MPTIYPAGSKVIRLGRERRGVAITPPVLVTPAGSPPAIALTNQPLIRIHAGYGVTLSGSNVVSLQDYGSLGPLFSTIVGTPQYVTNAHNGLPSIRFAGDSYLQIPTFLSALSLTDYAMLVVGTNTEVSGVGGRVLFSNHDGSAVTGFDIGEDSAWKWAGHTEGTTVANPGANDLGLHAVLFRGLAGGSNFLQFDTTSTTTSGTTTRAPNTTGKLTLGAATDGGSGTRWKGDFCEAFIWGLNLPSADRSAVLSYVSSQWGITIS